MDTWFPFVLFGAAALLVRAGLALYATGSCRSKNAAGAVLRVVFDFCAATLAFWAIGASILFQSDNPVFSIDVRSPPGGFRTVGPIFFYAIVATVGTGIVVGALAERSKFFTLAGPSVLLAAFVIPVAAHWAQRGWLANLGFIDGAGATWLHVAGGLCAAAGALAVGPRQNKYHRDGSTSVIPGHSVPLASAGALLLFVGWVPYVVGCVNWPPKAGAFPDRAALNVLLSAAAGGVASLVYGHAKYGKPDVLLTMTGLLGALVAVTAGAGVVAPPWAVLIGAAAGVVVPMAAVHIDMILKIDDPAGAVAIHAVGGAFGTLAAGVLAPGSFVDRMRHLGVQAVGLIAIAALAAACSFALFAILKRTVGLRPKEADEFDGLDLAEHDLGAYPDFQQNTIRSFHLREA